MRIIVPFAAGSTPDAVARVMADGFQAGQVEVFQPVHMGEGDGSEAPGVREHGDLRGMLVTGAREAAPVRERWGDRKVHVAA